MKNIVLEDSLKAFLQEDDLGRNLVYDQSLPNHMVQAQLKIKSDCMVAGLPFFVKVFELLGSPIEFTSLKSLDEIEGKKVTQKTELNFIAPFNTLLYAERVALNLLTRLSAIATSTNQFVEKASEKGVRILDTRKTTPGLRSFEKYASNLGGAYNHRLGTVDSFMIKDNHKKFFGGLEHAHNWVLSLKQNYANTIYEIHSLNELELALKLKLRYLMLDNFSPTQINEAVSMKSDDVFYEVSGGMTLDNLGDYLIQGIDFISISKFITFPQKIDISLKVIKRV